MAASVRIWTPCSAEAEMNRGEDQFGPVLDYETITPAGKDLSRAGGDDEAIRPPRSLKAQDELGGETLPFSHSESGAASAESGSKIEAHPSLEVADRGKSSEEIGKGEPWLARRGHAISYIGLFLFTAVLYFRPYEWIPAFSSLTSLAFWLAAFTLAVFIPTQFALEGNLTARPREVNFLLLFCLWALLGMPLAINPGEAWAAFSDSFIKVVLMFIVLVNVVRTERRLKGLMWLSLGVGVFLSYRAIRDFQSGNLTVEGYRVQGALGGMFGNPNDMALHLVMMIPIAVALFFGTRNPVRKILYAACAALMTVGMVVTYSRGAFLGFIVSFLVLMWKLGRRQRFSVMTVAVLVLLLFLIFAPGNYGLRLLSIFIPGLDPVGSATMRKEVFWRSAFVALKHPIFGVGMDNFHIVSIRELVSHNAYTQVSAELGIPALIIYLLFIVSPLKRLWQIERETFTDRKKSRFYYLAVALQASIVAYMVSSFFGSVAYQWYIYYVVGYAVALRRIYALSQEAADNAARRREAFAPA
jgi:O-antigen ligase